MAESAAAAVVAPVPPLAMPNAEAPERNVCSAEEKLLRISAMTERMTLSTFAGDIPVSQPMPSQVVLLEAVALQSKRLAILFFRLFQVREVLFRSDAQHRRPVYCWPVPWNVPLLGVQGRDEAP
jgi:hypothetical protein